MRAAVDKPLHEFDAEAAEAAGDNVNVLRIAHSTHMRLHNARLCSRHVVFEHFYQHFACKLCCVASTSMEVLLTAMFAGGEEAERRFDIFCIVDVRR